jgi:hypothetical protein
MTKPSTIKRVRPAAFGRYCLTRFERTVELTRKAIAKLQSQGRTVTLVALAELTREFDPKGKGLQPNTILRNPQAAELFRKESPAYQMRQHKAKNAKRRLLKPSSDVRALYRGLRPVDLVAMIEDLKKQTTELKTQQEKLRTERDEAYQLRDQALQQNTRQLAALTKSTTQVQLTSKSHEPRTFGETRVDSLRVQ